MEGIEGAFGLIVGWSWDLCRLMLCKINLLECAARGEWLRQGQDVVGEIGRNGDVDAEHHQRGAGTLIHVAKIPDALDDPVMIEYTMRTLAKSRECPWKNPTR